MRASCPSKYTVAPKLAVEGASPGIVEEVRKLTRLLQIGIVTEAASTYKVSISSTTRTLGYDVTATAQDVCVLKGTTEADCAATLAVSAAGTSTTVSASTTYTGANYYRYDVQVTGGAEKLVNPTACANSAPKGLNTKAVAVLSLLSAVGAAGLLAV